MAVCHAVVTRGGGTPVRQEAYTIGQWRADAASGKLKEAFACGTAAVVTPIGKLVSPQGEVKMGAGGPGQVTTRIKQKLVDIQRGTAPDPHGWGARLD